MPRYPVLTPLRREGKTIPAGRPVTLDAAEARTLIACGALGEALPEPPVTTEPLTTEPPVTTEPPADTAKTRRK
ncbi:hypothetical protein [Telmatospirillum sp. J64-1]|uniref:hypothetical protein n=1 Tax=Telmatospirillum sp. J64-1 TaxID=2502183 RepID=UPI00115E143D|nr:hypothetical protein [Telmatospirillum sp. J64-1]